MQTNRHSRQNAETHTNFLPGQKNQTAWPAAEKTRDAWEKLHDRLREEQLIPPQQVTPKNIGMHYLMRIAATLLILLGTATIIYILATRWSSDDRIRIQTGPQTSTLIKTLNDGSVIYLAQNSLFSFPEKFESKSRHVELKGEAFFDIAPNPVHPFIIETDEALIQVLGTAFNVKTLKKNGIELFVDRGNVQVTLKNDPSHSEMVTAGEMVSTSMNRLVKSKYHANEATSWYKEHMHFKDETLQNIIHVLNRNFNTTFVVSDQETGQHRLTVTFHNETAETMAGLMCMALNLKSQLINGSVVLSDKKEDAKQH